MVERRRWRDTRTPPPLPPGLTEVYWEAYERAYRQWTVGPAERLSRPEPTPSSAARPDPFPVLSATHPVARRWWAMVLTAALGAAIALGITVWLPAPYVASLTLVVDLPPSSVDTETIISTVQGLATSRAVLGELARQSGEDLTPSAVGGKIRVERAIGAGLIEVSVVDRSSQRAERLAADLAPLLEERAAGGARPGGPGRRLDRGAVLPRTRGRTAASTVARQRRAGRRGRVQRRAGDGRCPRASSPTPPLRGAVTPACDTSRCGPCLGAGRSARSRPAGGCSGPSPPGSRLG